MRRANPEIVLGTVCRPLGRQHQGSRRSRGWRMSDPVTNYVIRGQSRRDERNGDYPGGVNRRNRLETFTQADRHERTLLRVHRHPVVRTTRHIRRCRHRVMIGHRRLMVGRHRLVTSRLGPGRRRQRRKHESGDHKGREQALEQADESHGGKISHSCQGGKSAYAHKCVACHRPSIGQRLRGCVAVIGMSRFCRSALSGDAWVRGCAA